MNRISGLQMLALGLGVALSLGGCQSPIDQAAEKQFKDSLGNTTITVYPTLIRRAEKTYDAEGAERIVEFLTAERLAEVVVSDEKVVLPGPWRVNESKMWRESSAALCEHVKEHSIQTRYALLAEYLMGTGTVPVGVHWYVVDAEGRLAGGSGENSHHRPWQEVNPKNVADCHEVLLKSLRQELKPAEQEFSATKAEARNPQAAVDCRIITVG